ncbi:hypothetical protein LBMAG53_10930 [Planctomycetota bacterium]|nr:hypothetical protein LBMAG53_10930 [Planctomycetota bacterium]
MNSSDPNQDPELDEQDQLDQEEELQEEENQRKDIGWVGWLISGAIHAALILIMAAIVVGAQILQQDPPAVRVAAIETPPKKEEKPKDRALQETVEVNIVSETETPNPVTALEMPVEKLESEDESDAKDAKGREEAVANSEMGGQGAFMAIGAGGGSSGMFGKRTGGGRKRAVGLYGGSKGSESAVEAGLRWLKRHQSPNGVWDLVNYPNNCEENPKCEPGKPATGNGNNAMTGYAVLCFLGAGYDHKTPNKYRDTVKRGVEFLVASQAADGGFGRNYENGICTMALAEAFAMTGDPDLKDPAQRGIDKVCATQANDPKGKDPAYDKLGWDYGAPNPGRSDSSVSGWNVMALKSGLAAGLDVKGGIDGSKHWLEVVWKATNPGWETLDVYKGESKYPYTYDGNAGTAGGHTNLACVGMVACVFLGHHAGDVMLETLANFVMAKQTPATWAQMNLYYSYYNTLGIFQLGGEKWKTWNGVVRDLFVNNQRKGEGCFDGSWNWDDSAKFHGIECGRIISTVYSILSLEVYYRYDQVAGKPAKKGP